MREGIDFRFLRRATLVCVTVVAAVAAGAVALSRLWFPDARQPAEPPPVAGPRLEARPQADLRRYQHAKQQQLRGYAWVDASRGIARIPLDQAMRALAAPAGPPGPREHP